MRGPDERLREAERRWKAQPLPETQRAYLRALERSQGPACLPAPPTGPRDGWPACGAIIVASSISSEWSGSRSIWVQAVTPSSMATAEALAHMEAGTLAAREGGEWAILSEERQDWPLLQGYALTLIPSSVTRPPVADGLVGWWEGGDFDPETGTIPNRIPGGASMFLNAGQMAYADDAGEVTIDGRGVPIGYALEAAEAGGTVELVHAEVLGYVPSEEERREIEERLRARYGFPLDPE